MKSRQDFVSLWNLIVGVCVLSICHSHMRLLLDEIAIFSQSPSSDLAISNLAGALELIKLRLL